MNKIHHVPVLLQEVLQSVPKDAQYIVDGTLGHGGHTFHIYEQAATKPHMMGIDLDAHMLAKAQQNLEDLHDQIVFVHGSYTEVDEYIHDQGRKGLDYLLVDVGVNMEHFKDTIRGFSIKGEAPLDMRFDDQQEFSAQILLATYSKTQLQEVFEKYAEFTPAKAGEIATVIVTQRKISPLQTTLQLKTLLNSCGLGEKAIVVIFQSLRIEVNQELKNIETFISKIPLVMNPGGRCAIITFHSLEDRLVKNTFKELLQKGWTLYTKKAIQATYQEKQRNKASRSAKLRVIQAPL
ncbi:MAG: 16S rRNA (cytosine(1402)-N(4))-methyltransferase RsmH [Candidatus Absconditabacteria bacterium]